MNSSAEKFPTDKPVSRSSRPELTIVLAAPDTSMLRPSPIVDVGRLATIVGRTVTDIKGNFDKLSSLKKNIADEGKPEKLVAYTSEERDRQASIYQYEAVKTIFQNLQMFPVDGEITESQNQRFTEAYHAAEEAQKEMHSEQLGELFDRFESDPALILASRLGALGVDRRYSAPIMRSVLLMLDKDLAS